eukprot:CAMPEP_0177585076 /NCGR_PEP_ID=MMETSP0419_2-20121207/4268_1 /TAXON_ID=582737 /ORGANISM="Tetraselmis sp., Strain GSL018" /LENGTH=390 /DNA_ID=CAMNT_0019074721 /DNA_START=417 /DNA_END=1590 /DNA_ORIENTATION=-
MSSHRNQMDSSSLNCVSTTAPTAAPWATGLPQAPTAAPWADSNAGNAEGGRPLTPVPSGGKVAPPFIVEATSELPGVAPDLSGHQFCIPRKMITSAELLKQFLESESLKEYIGFLMACNDAVKGRKLSEECKTSPVIDQLQKELSDLSQMIDEIPPLQTETRFGNPAYRDWAARMLEGAQAAVSRILPEHLQDAVPELVAYWAESFGNVVRIDYGTGHETNFGVFLFCLAKIGALTPECLQAIVTRVFVSYLNLMRKLQLTYWLEPAGSHGVWGLDDYQFLPFYWGAGQLVGHPYIKPKSIHTEEVLEGFSHEYLYLGCVTFVRKVKKGPIAETSPMINDISGVPNWSKVNSGMMKMYQAEVLSKLPIMQHMLLGASSHSHDPLVPAADG